jgi:endoglucanase
MRILFALILVFFFAPANAQTLTISYPVPFGISAGAATPFAGISINDANPGATSDIVTISLIGTSGGTLSGNNLTGTGPYTLTTTPANMNSDLAALTYIPSVLNGSFMIFGLSVTSFQTTILGTASGAVELDGLVLTTEIPYPAPIGTFTPRNFKGVNIAGAENTYPSTSQYNYIYPAAMELDYWASKGMGLIRMPVRLRRIQPNSYGRLDPAGRIDEPAVAGSASGTQTNLLAIKAVLDRAFIDGLYVVIDPHDFGFIHDTNTNTDRQVGADHEGTAQFVDWWIRVATVFKNYPNVIFGLMNEPEQETATQWKMGATAAINGIAQVTTARWVFIPGTFFTGGHSWVSSGNATAWAGYVPPAGMNIAFEMHEYLDSDFSGQHAVCAGFGSSPMTAATAWANINGFKIWIGEIGWSQDASCPPDAAALMGYFTANEPTYLGWAYWVGGSSAFYQAWNGTAPYALSAIPAGYPSGPFTGAPQTSILTGNLN